MHPGRTPLSGLRFSTWFLAALLAACVLSPNRVHGVVSAQTPGQSSPTPLPTAVSGLCGSPTVGATNSGTCLPSLPAPQAGQSLGTYYSAPGTVLNASATALDANDIEIDWSYGGGEVYGYLLVDGSDNASVVYVGNETFSYVLTGLQPGIEYCIIIFAYNSAVYPPPSPTVCATTQPN